MKPLTFILFLSVSFCPWAYAGSKHDLQPSKLVKLPNGKVMPLITADSKSLERLKVELKSDKVALTSISKNELDEMMHKYELEVVRMLEYSKL
ncbi:hypothetical protein [Thalassotalea mangrovi]|uniref:Uncharacterized protein n=1 Tax=Thalassotalea mangrovi TaxID=2572245 RepID=A0A4U1B5H4_9GAMM|nr:hypothetical protein [Thalassotalea mangrovi]TKB44879.1 hypothetical protein E8M12_10255 [Thalassotalea mangrovi]